MLKPIIYGLAIAYLLNPIVNIVDRHLLPVIKKRFPRFKRKESFVRAIGIMTGLLLLIAIVVTLFNMMIPELYRSIRDMVPTVPSQMNHFLESFAQMNSENSTIGKFAAEVLEEAAKFLQNWMRTDLLGTGECSHVRFDGRRYQHYKRDTQHCDRNDRFCICAVQQRKIFQTV